MTKYLAALGFILIIFSLEAIPTSIFWTPCTTDVVETGSVNLNVIDYFTVFRNRHASSFNTDIGATWGILSYRDVKAEVGVDYFAGTNNDWLFNGKISVEEEKFFGKSPSMSIGIFGVGVQPRKTNYNVADIVLGKSLPECIGGKFYFGLYAGNKTMGRIRQGFMLAYQRSFCETNYCDGRKYKRWIFSGDYASGKNYIGGGGISLSYYFTPDIYAQTGPVWFNDATTNGKWKWSIQLYALLPAKGFNNLIWGGVEKKEEKERGKQEKQSDCTGYS